MWNPVSVHSSNEAPPPFCIELSYKLAADQTSYCPPRLWRCRAEVDDAGTPEVLARLIEERHVFDEDIARWRVVQRLDQNTDISHYVTAPSDDVTGFGLSYRRAPVDFCELR